MKKIVFLSIILGYFSTTSQLSAQQNTDNQFTPNGSPILKVFSNFHTSITEDNDNSAIEIKRVYLGYEYQLSKEFSIEAKLDIGSPDDKSAYSLIKRYAYFKTAALLYKNGKLSARFGLIDLRQFYLQEKFWGYRYIYKSFMDEHRYGPSADIGGSVSYAFNEFISADFTIMNGEGYNQLQADNTYKGGIGLTVKPLSGLVARIYYDETSKGLKQSVLANFLGYKFKNIFSIGAEYNLKYNDAYVEGRDQTGFSAYATYFINDQFQLFGRYDRLTSNKLEADDRPWNLVDDGTAIIGGLQYKPIKQVKIALNYQDWYPLAQNASKEAYLYLSFEYKVD
ncbi:MAG: porin [Bacteroidota bacterium]|nr:porin [Bacteroidota bacterium]